MQILSEDDSRSARLFMDLIIVCYNLISGVYYEL